MEQESSHVPPVRLTLKHDPRREVIFNYEVDGAPDDHDPYNKKRTFRPRNLTVVITNGGEIATVESSGLQVLKGGKLGANRIRQHWFRPTEAHRDKMPEWVRDAAQECASEAFHMGWV